MHCKLRNPYFRIQMARKNKIVFETEITCMVNWAIVSQLKPYQLAYRINEACQWNLYRLKNLNPGARNKTIGFALFTYQRDEMKPEFYLISLKENKNILVKELKQFDFIIQVRLPDEDTIWDAEATMQRIKSIENVLGVFDINIDSLKSADMLFFDKQLDRLEEEIEPVKRKKITKLIK